MEKKLFFKFSDGSDYSDVIMMPEDVISTLKSQGLESMGAEQLEEIQFTLVPVLLTDEEYANLPEADF